MVHQLQKGKKLLRGIPPDKAPLSQAKTGQKSPKSQRKRLKRARRLEI